jgi:hypothetical protein
VNVLAPIDIECEDDDVDVNKSPFTPDVPAVPDVPEVPDEPDVPDEPLVPDEPDVPAVPDVPEVPEVPDEPDEPLVPATPFVPADIWACKKSRLVSISNAVNGEPFVSLLTNAIIYILLLYF